MNEVIPGLWLGGVSSVRNVESLRANKVSRIVSVCDYNPLEYGGFNKATFLDEFQQLFVCADDDIDQDLMDHFDECFSFIDAALKADKGVLVHCQVGVSRSATIVIGYLMQRENLSLDAACKKVSAARPIISPNPGFMSQLALLERMGGRVDPGHPHYRQYRLTRVAAKSAAAYYGGAGFVPVDDIPCVADPQQQEAAASAASAESPVFRCRRCRRPLFRESGRLTHATYRPKGRLSGIDAAGIDPDGDGDDFFLAVAKDSATAAGADDAASGECRRELFLEPVEWMRQEAGAAVSGKLACPKCAAKIGSFTWVGERCSCGGFVCPAFHARWQAVDAPPGCGPTLAAVPDSVADAAIVRPPSGPGTSAAN